MKRYFIRCMGAILSSLSIGTITNAGTVDSHDYTVTVAENSSNRWYVGWRSNNKNCDAEIRSSFTNGNNIFYQELLTEDDIDADAFGYGVDDLGFVYVTQPEVYSGGGIIISAASYSLLNPGDRLYYTGARVGGTATGFGQYILVDRNVDYGNVGSFYYVATPNYFQEAGCCKLNLCSYSGQGGDCSGFSYSGNGESCSKCPCYYTYADVSYSGDTNCNASVPGGGPYPASGLSTTSNYSKYCPNRIQDAIVCYQHQSCKDSKYTDKDVVGQGLSGCDMILNPLVGMMDAVHNDIDYPAGWDLGRVTCTEDNMSWYCTPLFMSGIYGGNFMNYMTTTDAGKINWCTACPVPTQTTMNTFPLTNTSYSSNGGIGIASCYVKGPTATDNSGTFEFTTSAGATQTCYGDRYAT